MPISRYEIRNEYSLADPELYRAADKDDPEALLEGVAMAGLVGVLRQLGDLAEFAAEVFHNLHEEVMATAARGHGLMVRVQQLETEIPSIEKALLSRTDHLPFFNHAGVDCHPNLRVDQNLVTQGDLPRFIMDSYEECRAPPRLFILDKFDVAGAGACLKRYTDPSFFKVENPRMTDADIPREKKMRKAKKKGPRWRNGETSDVLPTSHTKLHQLFLEEHSENVVNNPSRRVKLKRRLNGFPFDSKTGKSYMEKILKSSSPDNKELCEVIVNSTLLMLAASDHNESGAEVLEIRPVSRDRENVRRKRSPPSSPDRQLIMMNSSVYERSEVVIDDKICEAPNSHSSIPRDGGISSTLDKVTGEKVIVVDAESNRESSLTGYQSDDISSEVDNYMDAPSTMESETDAESRVKSKFTSLIRNEISISDANEENLQSRSLDSQSIGDSTISDDGNHSSRKEMPCSSSDSPSTSSYQKIADDEFPVDQHLKPVIYDDTCPNTDAITNGKSDYLEVTSSLCSNGFIPSFVPSEYGDVRNGMSDGPKSDKRDSTLDDEEKKSNLVMDLPCSPSVSDSDLQARDDSPQSSTGEHLMDEANGESIPCISTASYIHYNIANNSNKATSDSLHGDEYDQEDRNLVENVTNSSPNELIYSENLIPGKLEYEFPKSPNNFPSDNHIVHNGDNINSTVSKEENLVNGLGNDDSDVPTDSPIQFPCFMEAFLKKKLEETSSADAQTIDAEEDHCSNSSIDNQICSENNSPDLPGAGLKVHERDVIPEEYTSLNETFALETSKSSEVLGSLGTGITHHVSPTESEARESSSSASVDLKEPAETSNSVEMNQTSSSGQEYDVSDSGEDKSKIADMASAAPTLSDIVIIHDDVPLPVGIIKLVEEKNNFFENSGLDELAIHKSCSTEKVDQTKDATSGFETVLCDTNNNSHLDLEADQGLIIESPVEQSFLDREHKIFQQSTLGNHVSDAPSLPINCKAEESIVPEEIGLLPSQLDQELPKDPFDVPNEIINHDIDVPKDPFTETKINLADLPPLPPLPPVQWRMGRFQLASSSTEGEMMNHKELFPQLISQPITSTDDASSCPPTAATDFVGFSLPTSSINDDSFSLGEMKHSPIADESSSKEEKAESSCMEVNTAPETIDLPGKSENEQQQFVTPTSESEFTSPAEEDGVANGSRTGKLPRPRNPLIDEVAAIDKSKLRKVTERVRPEIQKVDERDSLLEQIRAKSFNLKPALASRPSIRGPNTNLKVAAILEKANAIRQALAGSDEDDDDSWSDS